MQFLFAALRLGVKYQPLKRPFTQRRKAAKETIRAQSGVCSTKRATIRHNRIMSQLNEGAVLDALRQIKDPDLHKDIVTLGFIKDLVISGAHVSFRIVLTTPACPVREEMQTAAREYVSAISGVQSVNVTMDADVPKGRGVGD